jgi:hypothetical protein
MNYDAHTRQDLIDVIAALDAQNKALREALEEIRRVGSGANDYYIDRIARAALAATEPK